MNEKADRKRRRRPLEDDELARLLATTAASLEAREGMTGADRATLYRLAVETGLRSSELRSLTPESFALADLQDASVSVAAAYSKRRRDDVSPCVWTRPRPCNRG